MRKILIILVGFIILVIAFATSLFFLPKNSSTSDPQDITWWEIQAIDTMKYSRDLAREKAKDPTFDQEIEKQVSAIAGTGATHVSIGTPYDEEFIPFMKRWIDASRRHGMNVWFRGNFSGWEKWFNYEKITRDEHTKQLEEFILSNGDLFEKGDIFSPCTECENGGPGDPRQTGDRKGHQQFLISQYKVANESFRKVGKNVRTNFPMNGDIARLIMDKETTKALGGIVVVDHYVGSAEKLSKDIEEFAEISGGRVILGEYGVPIPDLHGRLTEVEQAEWINNAFGLISQNENLIGVNYWTSFGGSTMLWRSDGRERAAVDVLRRYFAPKVLDGKVVNEIGQPVVSAKITFGPKTVRSDENGNFAMAYTDVDKQSIINASGYKEYTYQGLLNHTVVLIKEDEGIMFKLRKFIRGFLYKDRLGNE